MKKMYHFIGKAVFVVFAALLPIVSVAQDGPGETKAEANTANCYKYWSVGAFGGLMQFNGDLSRNLFFNLYSNSIGYNVGFTATKQFSRVIGLRARFAYGNIHSSVTDKWVWEYLDGNGTPTMVTHSFRSSLFETDLQMTINWTNWILGYKPERIVSSYLIGGIGVDHSSGTLKDAEEKEIAYLGHNGNPLNVGNTSGIGGDNLQMKLAAGLGFDFNLSKHFSIPIEFIWRWQNSDLLDMTMGGAKGMSYDMYSSGTVGITYKFGYSCPKPVDKLIPFMPAAAMVLPTPQVKFSAYAPRNIPTERNAREFFPVRNYVFFDSGSVVIPDRYVLLGKDQVKDFKEENVYLFTPKNLSGRSQRQMIVYYNILNILGDRMGKNPSATIRLTGASLAGPEEGKIMAESIQRYLVEIFGINPSRITVEGRVKPRIPSEQPGGMNELGLLHEGDRRVSIMSNSPALLMEFQSGEEAPWKPVEIVDIQVAPIESYVSFYADGANEAFLSWSLEFKDSDGIIQNFGPYSYERVSIPGKSILGSKREGTYKVTMVGHMRDGLYTRQDTTIDMVLWTPPKTNELMRFSVIYEFDESKVNDMYVKYLIEVVLPKIPTNGAVIIHGYTDVIGDKDYNLKLSEERATDVKGILEKGLKSKGRTDVHMEVYGFGENQDLAPFGNKFPEERFYNRTVVIDIIPQK